MNYLERSKQAWVRASDFPADKEAHYPDHTIVQEFDSHHGKLIYEYGIGGGSDMLSYLRRGNTITGSDIVPKNVETARQRILEFGYIEGVDFEVLLLENSVPIPSVDNRFDIISSHGVLHHIIDPRPVVDELFRICKPGGYFYYMLYSDVMWDYFWDKGDIQRFMRTYGIDKYEAFGYCTDNLGTPYSKPYTTEEAIALSEDAGFKVVDFTFWLNDHFLTAKARKPEV